MTRKRTATTTLPADDGFAGADGPERRCIVTGESGGRGGLIRFVLDPDDRVVPDLSGRLPGRGLWVTADRATLERAVARQVFRRAARRPVEVPADLVATVEAGLRRRVRELVGLARRAGAAVAGFEKVSALLAARRAAVLLEASDGAEGGRGKLRGQSGGLPVVACLDSGELGLAFGRPSVVHAALAPGGLAERFLEEARRLHGVAVPLPPDGAEEIGRTTRAPPSEAQPRAERDEQDARIGKGSQ